MKLYYSDTFVLPLPEGHRFPLEKYALLRERLQSSGLFSPSQFELPSPVSDTDLLKAHTREYLTKVTTGTLSPAEIRRIGFPWSTQLVERSRRSAGATLQAARGALEVGFGVNMAGGTHHAFRDCGEGYCIFNDSAIAALVLQAEGKITRALIVDLDVHQGNGTAKILAHDPSIFTFSIHGAKNFPLKKEKSDLDIALDKGTGDGDYLSALELGLQESFECSRPDLVLYLAGADPFYGDRLGTLALTKVGLAQRDTLVFDFCEQKGCPVAIAMAGGYARNVEDIVDIHFQTIIEAQRRWQHTRGHSSPPI